MDYIQLSKKLLDVLGKKNILQVESCMTRLRVKVKEQVDLEKIKSIEKVLGVISENDEIQIVLGPSLVSKVKEELISMLPNDNLSEISKENKKKNSEKYDGGVQKLFRKIANIFVPILPGIIASGLIMGVTNIINVMTQNRFNNEWYYLSIRSIGFIMFAYLSIFVCMNAVKEFGGTPILGGIIGGLFVFNANLPILAKIDGNSIVLPITNKPFSPGMGGLLASLFMGIIIAKIEKSVRKIVPNILDTFLTPLITLILGVFIAVLFIQPVGDFVTKNIYVVLDFIYNKYGLLGGYILASSFLPLVSVGLHQALIPIHVLLNSPDGPTNGINYLLPILIMAGGGQVGAGLAIYAKTNSKRLKNLLRDGIVVGMLGIGEPLMYGVTLPLGKPFITACLGAGFGGFVASLFHLGTITQGVSGIFGLLIVVPGTWMYFVIAMISAYIGGFTLTYFFGVDENRILEIYGE